MQHFLGTLDFIAQGIAVVFCFIQRNETIRCVLIQGPLNRWTSQLDLGNMTGELETVVSVHNSI